MSESILKDGTGTGNRAKVDSANRLQTQAVVQPELSYVSHIFGVAFTFTALERQILVSGGEKSVLWLKNTDTVKKFFINRISLSWTGGNINHDRMATLRVKLGASTPTANFITTTGGNLNLTSSTIAQMEGYKWDGVGNGMTVANQGTMLYSGYFDKGLTIVPFEGAVLLGFGNILNFTLESEEDGYASLIVSGWYNGIR